MKSEGTLHTTTQSRTLLAPFWLTLAKIVKALPSYKDSKRGRQNVMQLRFVLLGVGIACIAFGGSNAWVVAGLIICVIPLIAPIESGTRTAWVSSLRRNAQQSKTRKESATIEREKNRVTVTAGSQTFSASVKKKKRKVLWKHDALIGFRDENGDRLWFRCEDAPDDFPENSPDANEQFRVIVDVDLETFEQLDA